MATMTQLVIPRAPALETIDDAERDPRFLHLPDHNISILRYWMSQWFRSQLAQATTVAARRIPACPQIARDVQEEVVDAFRKLQPDFDETDEFHLKLISEEAIKNGIRKRDENGDPFYPDKFQHADVHFGVSELDGAPRLFLYVKDTGKGFDPNQVRNPVLPENLTRMNGRGLLLIGEYSQQLNGRALYLPSTTSDDPDEVVTRELLLDLPLQRDVRTAAEIFHKLIAARSALKDVLPPDGFDRS